MSADTEKPLPWPPLPKANTHKFAETIAFSHNPGEKESLAGNQPAPALASRAGAVRLEPEQARDPTESPLQELPLLSRIFPVSGRALAVAAVAVASLALVLQFSLTGDDSIVTGDQPAAETTQSPNGTAARKPTEQTSPMSDETIAPVKSDAELARIDPAPELARIDPAPEQVPAKREAPLDGPAGDAKTVSAPVPAADGNAEAETPAEARMTEPSADIREAAAETPASENSIERTGSVSRVESAKKGWLKDVWEPRPFRRMVSVGRGDTLMGLMVRAGIARGEAHRVIVALQKVFDPRRLRPGQDLGLKFFPTVEGDRFIGVTLDVAADRTIDVSRDEENFTAREIRNELSRELVRNGGRIESSLYAVGIAKGVPPTVMVDLIHIYSFDVDFQRDIRAGDSFEIMHERYRDARRQVARNGEILYASLTLSGRTYRLWRHKTADGMVDYYNEKGHSVRKALMRTPLDGARLSSGFGMRRHPVLGYSRMHRGTDFAAPRGTPIYAAGDGRIEKAGRWGAFGKYVRIRHNGTYKTAYAHMNGFARGIRTGKRVHQGQVIGYVGSTGRSTGPHLHYEVFRDSRQINSRTMRLPSGRKLKGKALATYLAARTQREKQFAAISDENSRAAGATESALAGQAGMCGSGAVGGTADTAAC